MYVLYSLIFSFFIFILSLHTDSYAWLFLFFPTELGLSLFLQQKSLYRYFIPYSQLLSTKRSDSRRFDMKESVVLLNVLKTEYAVYHL